MPRSANSWACFLINWLIFLCLPVGDTGGDKHETKAGIGLNIRLSHRYSRAKVERSGLEKMLSNVEKEIQLIVILL